MSIGLPHVLWLVTLHIRSKSHFLHPSLNIDRYIVLGRTVAPLDFLKG